MIVAVRSTIRVSQNQARTDATTLGISLSIPSHPIRSSSASYLLVVLARQALVVGVELHEVRLERLEIALQLLEKGLSSKLVSFGLRGGRLHEGLDGARACHLQIELLDLM